MEDEEDTVVRNGIVCPYTHITQQLNQGFDDKLIVRLDCNGTPYAGRTFNLARDELFFLDDWVAEENRKHLIAYLQGEVVTLRAKILELEELGMYDRDKFDVEGSGR